MEMVLVVVGLAATVATFQMVISSIELGDFKFMLRQKSGTSEAPMTKEPVLISSWSGATIEIIVGSSTLFRSESLEIAKAFLNSLDKMQVQLSSGPNRIHTAADIAYLILDRQSA